MKSLVRKLFMFQNGEYIKELSQDEFEYLSCLNEIQKSVPSKTFDRFLSLDDRLSIKYMKYVLFGLLLYFLLGLFVGLLLVVYNAL